MFGEIGFKDVMITLFSQLSSVNLGSSLVLGFDWNQIGSLFSRRADLIVI